MSELLIYASVFGTFFTAIVSFYLGSIRIRNTREQFYENKISELLRVQALEIQSLKSEVAKLVKENQDLRKEIEKGNRLNEHTIEEVSC